MTLKNTK